MKFYFHLLHLEIVLIRKLNAMAPINILPIQYPQKIDKKSVRAARVNKFLILKEFPLCYVRFRSLLARFRGKFRSGQSYIAISNHSQSKRVDVSNDPNWTNLISGVCCRDILREIPGTG